MTDEQETCLAVIRDMKVCPLTLAMRNKKVLGSSSTVFDWVYATLCDLEVEIVKRLEESKGKTP